MKTIKVYCGESVQDKCGREMHPFVAVKLAEEKVLSLNDEIIFSNNTDMVSGIKYIAEKHKVNTEFFLNGVSHGSDIEPIFADFNRSLDLLNELTEEKEYEHEW